MEDMTEVKTSLETWIAKKIPQAERVSITEPEKPGMGLSSETILFDIEWTESGEQKTRPVVLRAAPQEGGVFPEYELGHQFRIMQLLKDTDVPVANMLWLEEDPSVIGAPFFLMDRLTGEVPQDYPSYHGSGMYFEATPEQRTKMWMSTLECMTNIHKLDWKGMEFSFLGEPKDNADAVDRQIAYWDNYLNNWLKDDPSESHPTMEAALDWLKENRYAPERLTLCWGDARIGNTLYSIPDKNVLAIMDWEMAFIGDPIADLAWFFTLDKQHSKGYGLPRLEGTPEDEEIIKRYEELTGWKVENLLYNEVLATFRYGGTVIAVLKKFIKQGIPIDEDMIYNNFPTQHLSDLLGLPSPGEKKQEYTDVNEVTAIVQFHFTGPGGSDWYLLCDKGKGSKHDGVAQNPNCVIKVSVEDWKAIQSGDLNRLDAWSTGRLITDGDLGLLALLEDMMNEFTR